MSNQINKTQINKTQINEIVDRVSEDFKSFFLKMPSCSSLVDGLCIEFEMKEQYQRSVDLPCFEQIMERFMHALKYEFGLHNIPLKWWSCSATEMEWVME